MEKEDIKTELQDELFVECSYDREKKLAVASTAAIDRHGESIDQSGWQLENFLANPVMLWAHDHTQPAIGVAENTRVSRAGGEKRLVFEPKFHDKTDLAKAIKFLYEGDEENPPVLNSFSVGFKPIDFDGTTYTKQELLEISAVNVPANAEARMSAYKALKEAGFKKKTMKELGLESEVLDMVHKLDKDVTELRKELDEVKAAKAVNPETRREANERLSMIKVIARASDKILEGEKKALPKANRVEMTKVIKKAAEQLAKKDLEKVR